MTYFLTHLIGSNFRIDDIYIVLEGYNCIIFNASTAAECESFPVSLDVFFPTINSKCMEGEDNEFILLCVSNLLFELLCISHLKSKHCLIIK